MKGNNNAILIYENKYGSKLIWKMQGWIMMMEAMDAWEKKTRRYKFSTKSFNAQTPPKIALQTCNITIG